MDLVREYKFYNSKQVHHGVPVIASNMDTVGTFEIAQALSKHKCYTCIHKYYTVDQWKEFATSNKVRGTTNSALGVSFNKLSTNFVAIMK